MKKRTAEDWSKAVKEYDKVKAARLKKGEKIPKDYNDYLKEYKEKEAFLKEREAFINAITQNGGKMLILGGREKAPTADEWILEKWIQDNHVDVKDLTTFWKVIDFKIDSKQIDPLFAEKLIIAYSGMINDILSTVYYGSIPQFPFRK